jgi:beta-glucosidase
MGSADLARDPRWGRSAESFGEDPLLAGTLITSFVQGLQGTDKTYWLTAAVLPHFLGSSREDSRDSSAADIDERQFYEVYSVPFRMAIEQGACRVITTAYHQLNGFPCAAHPLIEQLVIDKWGYDGIVATEPGSLRMLVSAQHNCDSVNDAFLLAHRAGTTQHFDPYEDALRTALVQAQVSEREIDRAVRKNFRIMLKLGLWDPPERVPYASIGYDSVEPWNQPEAQQFVRSVTQESIVLLKNEHETLPIDPGKVRSVALIGPLADRVMVDSRGGTPPYAITCADGLRERMGRGSVVLVSNNDESAAIIAAKRCDMAIVCVGNHPTSDSSWGKVRCDSDGKEDVDRKSITLEAEQLLRRVHAANPNTVLLLVSSFPYSIDWSANNLPAILLAPHCSQELGRAVADVLFGDYNPGGRLAQTWPRAIEDLPPLDEFDLCSGRTYQYVVREPLYSFGHGKSYTRFTYSRLLTSNSVLKLGHPISVSVNIANIGPRAGDEVVQLYVRFLDSTTKRPERMLVAFKRVTIAPSATKVVELQLRPEQLQYFDVKRRGFVLESGTVELLIGRSSAEIELATTLAVEGLNCEARSSRPPSAHPH